MFNFFTSPVRPAVIPSAKEVAVMVSLDVNELSFERTQKVESQIAELRSRAAEAAHLLITENATVARFSVCQHFPGAGYVGTRFEPEAIVAIVAELKALGYLVQECNTQVLIQA